MRLVLTGDWHVGDYRNGPDVDGVNGRFKDIQDRVDKLIRYCMRNNIRYIIFAGDMFKDKHPDMAHLEYVSSILKLVSNLGITMYVILGNHDTPKIKTHSHALSAYVPIAPPSIKIITEPTIEEVDGVRFLFFPQADPPQAPPLRQFLNNLRKDDILVMHGTIEGCNTGIFEYEICDDDVVPLEMLSKVKAVLAGDIHKAQHYENVWYPGSLERLTFNDEFDEKGFYDITITKEGVRDDFIKTESRRMVTINSENVDKLREGSIEVRDAIVRITGATDEALPEIKRLLREQGCYYIASIRSMVNDIRLPTKGGINVPDMVRQYAEKVSYKGDLASPTRTIIEMLNSVA